MEKVNAATEEVGNNYELAGQLDNGFNNVKEAVEKVMRLLKKLRVRLLLLRVQ